MALQAVLAEEEPVGGTYERSVKRVKGLLNRRPRKSLGFTTPAEVFFGKSLGENLRFSVESAFI